MDSVLICCETLWDEMQLAIRQTGYAGRVVLVESGLHNVPAQLRQRLQQELDRLTGAVRVLLGFGFCGGAMAGLHARGCQLVLPRADDCVTLMLGSAAQRKKLSQTYFLTRGWLRGEKNIWEEYKYATEKFGKQRGHEIMQLMLAQYKELAVLKTDAYNLDEIMADTQRIADTLGLQHTVVPSSVEYLCRLLCGPWDTGQFLVIPPHTSITTGDLVPA